MTPAFDPPKPGRSPGASRLEKAVRLLIAALLGIAIFWVDTFTPLSSAVAVLYVVVLLLAGDFLSSWRLWLAAATCGALAMVSFLGVHGRALDWAPTLRFVFSLAAIVATTLLVRRNHQARQVLLTQARLLDVTSDALFTRDAEGRVTFWNKGAERLYGWSCEEMLGANAHEVLASVFDRSIEEILAALARDGTWQGEILQRGRDGEARVVLSQWTLDRPGSGGVLETNTDISALRRASDALRESEIRYRTIFDTLAISIWEHDFRPVKAALEALRRQGVADMRAYLAQNPQFVRDARAMVRITDVNATALRMMGVAEKADFFAHLHDFLPETDESFEQCLIAIDEGHARFESETVVRSRTGELIPIIVALSFPPNGACLDSIQASVFNLTDRRRLQARLDQARSELDHALRAASIGVLTASIAHEVNQPITAAANAASAARRWLARDPPDLGEARLAIDDVNRATERAGEVVKGVRDVLAQAPTSLSPLALDELVGEAARLVGRELSASDVELKLELSCSRARVNGERILLQQVLVNLLVNGAQAMDAIEPPRILTVRTHHQGDDAVIDILDSGPGFTDEAAERALDAFYTTKPSGMGLGLAICASTLAVHEGSIEIVTRAMGAHGGHVRVRLPMVGAEGA